MERYIKPMDDLHREGALDFVQMVFTEHKDAEEGALVRQLTEEIRRKKYYLPRLELMMVDEKDEILGYAMFSRFHLEGRYEDAFLMLTPVAVRPDVQRQHISKQLLEYGFEAARAMGYKAVLVEGNPANYHARGFVTAADHGIVPGPKVHLPRIECMMVKELVPGALEQIHGVVNYSFYDVLNME